MDWEKYGLVIRSKNKKTILKALNSPKTPSQLSKETNLAVSTISKNLSQLTKLKLVKCLNPQLQMGKLFQITNEGKELLKKI